MGQERLRELMEMKKGIIDGN
jgi:hypothetical protein